MVIELSTGLHDNERMSYIVVIRHAIAEEPEEAAAAGRGDAERVVTDAGREKMVAAVAGLRTVVPGLSRVHSSPLRRAVQTAEIIAGGYACPTEASVALAPGAAPAELAGLVEGGGRDEYHALVGHEPDLSRWVG